MSGAIGGAMLRDEERPALPRFDDVDVLRGLSLLPVVLLHFYIRFHEVGFLSSAALPQRWIHLFFLNGRDGVTIFFAISGFLITLTSRRRFGSLSAMELRVFYRIRFARIAPLLVLVLGILSVLHLLHIPRFWIPPGQATLGRALWAAATFQLNFFEERHGALPASWNVMWSLSIEEMFYLFFPVVCVVLLRRRRGRVFFLGILLAFAAMGPFARTVWSSNDIQREKSYLGGMDGIAIGCLAALLTDLVLRRGGLRLWCIWAARLVGSGLILLIAWSPAWRQIPRLLAQSGLDGTVLAMATGMIMMAGAVRGVPGRLWTAPVRWLGRQSYEIYLTHEFVVLFGAAFYVRWRHGPMVGWLLAILALTALVGWLAALGFTKPMNKLLRGARMADPGRCEPGQIAVPARAPGQ